MIDAGKKAYEVGFFALGQMVTILYIVFTNAAKYLAAGIEWGFRNSLGILQEGIIWAYNNTFGLIPGMGISKAKPEDTRVSFQEVLKGYNIKGVLEDTTIREDFYKMLGVNTTQSNAPVENKPVPEVKTETEVEKKLTSTEDNKTKKVEVEFKNGIDVNVQGDKSKLTDENKVTEMIKDALRVEN